MLTVDDIAKEVSISLSDFDYGHSVVKVGIFGSVSRNEHINVSDIDLVIDYIYPENINLMAESAVNYMKLCGGIRNIFRKNYKKKVDIIEYKALEYPENEKIREEIERDVIWIYEK
ncbi:MAG: nucleotidyltransferase domain-containing protein [Oscillospiraceae bacterium]|nr:nucleotidyltransferase domain-containing protein [Oscillospiraceae bacterium]